MRFMSIMGMVISKKCMRMRFPIACGRLDYTLYSNTLSRSMMKMVPLSEIILQTSL